MTTMTPAQAEHQLTHVADRFDEWCLTDLPPCSEQVFSHNPLISLTILSRQEARPSAYIMCKLLEPGRGSLRRSEWRLAVHPGMEDA